MTARRTDLTSTTTCLDPAGTWDWDSADFSDGVNDQEYLLITGKASHGGTLYIYGGGDGSNWDYVETLTISAAVDFNVKYEIYSKHVKVSYTNGGTLQTYFRLYVQGRSA